MKIDTTARPVYIYSMLHDPSMGWCAASTSLRGGYDRDFLKQVLLPEYGESFPRAYTRKEIRELLDQYGVDWRGELKAWKDQVGHTGTEPWCRCLDGRYGILRGIKGIADTPKWRPGYTPSTRFPQPTSLQFLALHIENEDFEVECLTETHVGWCNEE